jgi:glyoxylase-like metal-dependent hydrolase (beta-lactamase superfamily II)
LKIFNLTYKSAIYTSNVYLVTGTWNRLTDTNALVDAGRDIAALEMIFKLPTGVGKKQVEKLFLTHGHYDHAGMLQNIKKIFSPTVYAYSRSLEGVDRFLHDGEEIKLGDRYFEVMYTPGHSSDSVCFYCRDDKVLFAGDAPVIIRSPDGIYNDDFIRVMEKICRLDVRVIYFGHGLPMIEGCNAAIRRSLDNLNRSIKQRPDERLNVNLCNFKMYGG